jgi:Leucine-rich repeat (LRR) protein
MDRVSSILEVSDGGYVVTGTTSSFGAGSRDIWVLKLDQNGDVEWQRSYGGWSSESVLLPSAQQTSDGGYIIAGTTESFGIGNGDYWLLKLNAAGDIQWQRTYGGSSWDQLYAIQETSDHGYIIAGITESFGVGSIDCWILKLGPTGIVQWEMTYGGTSADGVVAIWQTADGGYIVAGITESFGAGGMDCWILKLDSTGAVQWEKTYGGVGDDIAASIQQAADGGYIVAGITESFGPGTSNAWVLKLFANGNIDWQRTYGGSNGNQAFFIQQTLDGGYIVTGTTDSFSAGSNDYLVLKLNETGNIPSCGLISSTYVTGVASSATVQTSSATVVETLISPLATAATVTVTNAVRNFICAPSVSFPDPELEHAIRVALNKPTGPLTIDDLESLTALYAEDNHITDLTGLELCANLRVLDLGKLGTSNEISDLSPLSGLNNLLWLYLDGNEITDLSPLQYLTNLVALCLYGNEITNLAGLSGLINLERLLLGANKITDLTPLTALTSLRTLDLKGNNITDIQPLLANTGLGAGDSLNLQKNCLNLDEGSPAMHVINILKDRGVEVIYEPQRRLVVSDLNASNGEDEKVTLTWTNPSGSDLSKIVIRRKTGGYPQDHTDGTLVFPDSSPRRGKSETYVNKNLINDTAYYYAIFCEDTNDYWHDLVIVGENADTGTPGGGPDRTHTYDDGWQLVSIPFVPAGAPGPPPIPPARTTMPMSMASDIFGGVLYRWDASAGKYLHPTEVEPQLGYWLKVPPGSKTVSIVGDVITQNISIDVSASGWHMISTPWSYAKADILVSRGTNGDGNGPPPLPEIVTWAQAVAKGWVSNTIWGYSCGEFFSASSLDPWSGYWVRVLDPGEELVLILQHSQANPTSLDVATASVAAVSVAAEPPLPPREILASLEDLSVKVVPNPVADIHTARFYVQANAFVQQIKVQIFDLAGRPVYESEWGENGLAWHVENLQGEILANGVYLYQVLVRVEGIEEPIVSGVGKVAVCR